LNGDKVEATIIREKTMIRAIFVVLVAALIFGAVPKTSQATPIAP
jgi:hypothetical protein